MRQLLLAQLMPDGNPVACRPPVNRFIFNDAKARRTNPGARIALTDKVSIFGCSAFSAAQPRPHPPVATERALRPASGPLRCGPRHAALGRGFPEESCRVADPSPERRWR